MAISTLSTANRDSRSGGPTASSCLWPLALLLLGVAARPGPAVVAGHRGRGGRGRGIHLAVRAGGTPPPGERRDCGPRARGWCYWSPTRGSGGRSHSTSIRRALTLPFVVLLARDLADGRRRAWAWLRRCSPAATWRPPISPVSGSGPSWPGAARGCLAPSCAVVGVGYSLLVVFIHGDLGSTLATSLRIPRRHRRRIRQQQGHLRRVSEGDCQSSAECAADALGETRPTSWANLAPAGLLGVVFSLLSPILVIALLADNLSLGLVFAEPSFQALPIYVLLPVGTVAVLTWLARRHRRTALLLAGLAAAQTLGWAAVWGPRTPSQWLRVPAASAATLTALAAEIPASAEVIASQGVVGRFSGRPEVNELVHHRQAAGKWRRHLVRHRPGGWHRLAEDGEPDGAHSGTGRSLARHADHACERRMGVSLASARGHACVVRARVIRALPAWATPLASGTAARPVLSGPVRTWHLTSTGAPGYVC